MKNLKKYAAVSALAAAFTLSLTAPAFADPKHCPPGHAKKGWCSNYDRGHDHWDDRRDEARAYEEGYREGRRDAIRYNGRYYEDYRVIEDYGRYNLSAPPNGYYYAEVDGDILMVQLATQVVTQLLNGGY